MQFGMYAPLPHTTVGSSEINRSVASAFDPLPEGEVDVAFQLAKDLLRQADRSSFDLVLYAERHLGADLEAWVLASAMSALTSNMRSMVAVHPGLWRPELIAKMASSLDRVGPGRMAINLVTGWNVEEHRMFGGDIMLGDDERYVRAEEFVEVLRGMWTSTPFSHHGRFFKVDGAELRLKPATPAAPEIYAASRSERGLDMVAKVADWWFIDYDKGAKTTEEVMANLSRAMEDMDRRAGRFGRKVRYAFNPFVACDDSDDRAMRRVARLLSPEAEDFDEQKMLNRIGPAMKCGCVGRPEKVLAQIERFERMGIELLLFKFVPTRDEVAVIADAIIKPLRAR